MRESKIDIAGYPKIINPDILTKIANRTQPMASMPYYDKSNDETKLYEEALIEKRFKEVCDTYARSAGINKIRITPKGIMTDIMQNAMLAMRYEKPHRAELITLAEEIIREQYNLGDDEVIFDLEIVDPGMCGLPGEMNKEKRVKSDFTQSTDPDVLKKRTINALSQGAAKKSHYIFHMYRDQMDKINPELCKAYQTSLIANDLVYYMLDDDALGGALCEGDDSANAGFVKLDFSGRIPKIIARAISFPLLIHEMTKGVISFLSVPGIQNMSQELVDDTDYVMAELWEIRFGPTIWTNFHTCIEPSDYDIKKLIIMELFKLDSEEFLTFMDNVMNTPDEAKKMIAKIVKTLRNKIVNYQLGESEDNEDDY